MTHYMVVSPNTLDDPFDYDACVAFVDAPTIGKAKGAALRTGEFNRWRNCSGNPFVGLKVQKTACKHGFCWCDPCIAKHGNCPSCEAEMERLHLASLSEQAQP